MSAVRARLVGAIEREELLPRGDRAVDVAEVALAEPGDLAEALLAALGRSAIVPAIARTLARSTSRS